MGERHLAAELVESAEGFHKNFLHQIFGRVAARQMGEHNFADVVMVQLNELARGVIVARADAREQLVGLVGFMTHARRRAWWRVVTKKLWLVRARKNFPRNSRPSHASPAT
jgi:hypothetical protein